MPLRIESILSRKAPELATKYTLMKSRLLNVEYEHWAAGFPAGNNHGRAHITRVLEYLDLLLAPHPLAHVSAYELFLAMMSVLYHDIGILRDRKDHADISKSLLDGDTQDAYFFSQRDKLIIGAAVVSHSSSKSIDDQCAHLSDAEIVEGHSVRPKLVAALVRLADELDEDCRRADPILMQRLGVPAASAFYWWFCQRVSGVRPMPDSKQIEFHLAFQADDATRFGPQSNGAQRHFVAFAAEKLAKINHERATVNRFLPKGLQYRGIRAVVSPVPRHPEWKTPRPFVFDDGTPAESFLQNYPELWADPLGAIAQRASEMTLTGDVDGAGRLIASLAAVTADLPGPTRLAVTFESACIESLRAQSLLNPGARSAALDAAEEALVHWFKLGNEGGFARAGTQARIEIAHLVRHPPLALVCKERDASLRRRTSPELWPSVARDARDELISVERFTRPENVIFVFGSLLVPESLFRTLSRDTHRLRYVPAQLRGFRRRWGVAHPCLNMVDADWRSLEGYEWCALTVETAAPSDIVEGALIDVTHGELHLLKERESHYHLVDVTPHVFVSSGEPAPYACIQAFIPTGAAVLGSRAVVRRQHFEALDAALREHGHRQPLESPSAPLVDAFDADELLVKVWKEREPSIHGFLDRLENELHAAGAARHVSGRSKPIPSLIRPIALSHALHERVSRTAEAVVSLCTRALRVVIADEALRREAGLSDENVRDWQTDVGLRMECPVIARVDFSVSRKQDCVLELNSDSPGGMFHLDVLSRLHADFCRELGGIRLDYERQTPLAPAVVRVMMKRWADFCEQRGERGKFLRTVVILEREPRSWTTYPELVHFEALLKANGLNGALHDPRELRWSAEGVFLPDGSRVDVILKRVLANDLDRPDMRDAAAQLHAAVSRRQVLCLNGLGNRLIGNKYLLAVIQRPDFEALCAKAGEALTAAEASARDAYFPWTRVWRADGETERTVLADPSGYVLKSFRGYGSFEVNVGEALEMAADRFRDLLGGGHIVQRYVQHGRVEVPRISRQRVEWNSRNVLVGAYVVDGQCKALEAKASATIPVTMNVVAGHRGAYRGAVFSTPD